MTNLRKNDVKCYVKTEEKNKDPLDTLAQLRTKSCNCSDENAVTLYKRAVSKYITNSIIFPLIDLDNIRKKRYWSTFHCVNILLEDEGKIIGKYCKQRWCVVCNRIRTAKLIKGYLPQVEKWQEPRFITLTYGKTVDSCDLKQRIKDMQSAWRKITDSNRKGNWGIKGVRKLEVTYSKGRYHAHYHVLVDGYDKSEKIISEWRKRTQETKPRSPKDNVKADVNSVVELFKYFTKLFSKNSKGEIKTYPPKAMDNIFKVLTGKRTVQPFGGVKMIEEEFSDQEANIHKETHVPIVWEWHDDFKSWVDFLTGEILSKPGDQ